MKNLTPDKTLMTLIKQKARAYDGLTRMNADQKGASSRRRGEEQSLETQRNGVNGGTFCLLIERDYRVRRCKDRVAERRGDSIAAALEKIMMKILAVLLVMLATALQLVAVQEKTSAAQKKESQKDAAPNKDAPKDTAEKPEIHEFVISNFK